MSSSRDDDALSWGGDDDPTLDVGPTHDVSVGTAPRRTLPEGFVPLGKGSDEVAVEPHHAQLGDVGLVVIGMVAMAFIVYAAGWLVAGLRLLAVDALPVPGVTLGALTVAATAGPLLWFAGVFALTRHSRSWVRFAWLAVGLVLLLPWPFVVTGSLA